MKYLNAEGLIAFDFIRKKDQQKLKSLMNELINTEDEKFILNSLKEIRSKMN